MTRRAPARFLLPKTRSLPQTHYTSWVARAREGTWVRLDLDTDADAAAEGPFEPAWGSGGHGMVDGGAWLRPEVVAVPIPPHLRPGDTFTAVIQVP